MSVQFARCAGLPGLPQFRRYSATSGDALVPLKTVTRGFLRGQQRIAVTRTEGSHAQTPFDLVVRDPLPAVELGEAFLDLCEEHQPFDGILHGRVGRQFPKGLDHAVPGYSGWHEAILPQRNGVERHDALFGERGGPAAKHTHA